MSKYSTLNFTKDLCQAAKREWEDIAGGDAFDLELSPVFSWVETHMDVAPNDSVALCLWNNDSKRTDAVVEIVDSRKGKLSKLLKVIPSPRFWDVNNVRGEIIQLYTEAFFNVITAGGFGSSRVVKLYGRDDEMMSILRSIHAAWTVSNSTAEFEGRFLAISLN